MKLEYNNQELERFDNFKGGEKYLDAKMFFDGLNRILYGKLPVGGSIGEHVHTTNSEIIYIIDGKGPLIYDGQKEVLNAGDVHYCPQGHRHTFINESDDVVTFFAVVPEHEK